MFYLRYASVDLKPYVTSAPRNYILVLPSLDTCKPFSELENFPNEDKTCGVTFQSESCLMFWNSIFKVQVFAKVMDRVL